MDNDLFTTTLMDMVNIAVEAGTPVTAEEMDRMVRIAKSVAAGVLSLD